MAEYTTFIYFCQLFYNKNAKKLKKVVDIIFFCDINMSYRNDAGVAQG